jgi:uncharacterized protein YndB with AHSA1/START domain
MTTSYVPGPAAGAEVQKKEGERWTLVMTRELRHPPALVWQALTDPKQLAAWAPFDADRNLGSVGTATLTTLSPQGPMPFEAKVTRAEPNKALEHTWAGNDLRWELQARGAGTHLTLWINIDKRYISWGAAGWHICFEVLERLLDGKPVGRLAGPDAMKVDGWQRLTTDYAKQMGL